MGAFLRTLKNRADRSYTALAARSGASSSALHRYCAGASVPNDFGLVRHFAVACGATQPELRELHRLWTLADAARRGQPSAPAAGRPDKGADGRPPSQRLTLLVVAACAAVTGAAAWRLSAKAVPAGLRRH